MKEIRYNLANDSDWEVADYKNVFGFTPESLVDIKIDGILYCKCPVRFFRVGAGFLTITAKITDNDSITLHNDAYTRIPFASFDIRSKEIEIHLNGHIYGWRCDNGAVCALCGKTSKNTDNCKFYVDGEETVFSKYYENSIAIF